jgi:serine/threonine-protein kinase
MVVPSRPWKSVTAAFLSAAMLPCAHLLAARILGYPPASWNLVASYSLVVFFMAAWTPFISTRLHRMQRELSRAQDLGSYHLETMLGRGGMGEVWRASHKLLRRDAAVKLVHPGFLTEPDSPAWRQIHRRFELEAAAMATLRSPHTVALYDFGRSDDGSLYYVMELLDGLDAETLVDQYGPQPAGRVISILRQACESVEEAHEAGMVHRDVTPGNMFICRMGKGLTSLSSRLRPGWALTTPGNRAHRPSREPRHTRFHGPEQARGEEDIDARADIYSLGCLAYYLLTGSLVFHASSAISMALAHIEQKPEPPSQRAELPIPPSLERVVLSCLEKKREDRPHRCQNWTRFWRHAPMCQNGPRPMPDVGGCFTAPSAAERLQYEYRQPTSPRGANSYGHDRLWADDGPPGRWECDSGCHFPF